MKPRRKPKPKKVNKKRAELLFTWDDAWAIGRFDLGLSDDEFWALTPRKYNALLKRLERKERFQDWLAHRIVATIINVNKDPKKSKRPAQAEDFMRKYSKKEKPDSKAVFEQFKLYSDQQKIEKMKKGVI